MKETTLKDMLAKKPEYVINHAVKGMLPKGPLGRQMFKKLHVYAGAEHAVIIYLLVKLLACNLYFISINYNYIITCINMRCIYWLILANVACYMLNHKPR